jgi:hypothetical protein
MAHLRVLISQEMVLRKELPCLDQRVAPGEQVAKVKKAVEAIDRGQHHMC